MSSRRGCEVGGRAQGLEPFTSARSACGSPAFPAHVELGMAVRAAGLKSISIAVVERGLRVERPNESDPRAALSTSPNRSSPQVTTWRCCLHIPSRRT